MFLANRNKIDPHLLHEQQQLYHIFYDGCAQKYKSTRSPNKSSSQSPCWALFGTGQKEYQTANLLHDDNYEFDWALHWSYGYTLNSSSKPLTISLLSCRLLLINSKQNYKHPLRNIVYYNYVTAILWNCFKILFFSLIIYVDFFACEQQINIFFHSKTPKSSFRCSSLLVSFLNSVNLWHSNRTCRNV